MNYLKNSPPVGKRHTTERSGNSLAIAFWKQIARARELPLAGAFSSVPPLSIFVPTKAQNASSRFFVGVFSRVRRISKLALTAKTRRRKRNKASRVLRGPFLLDLIERRKQSGARSGKVFEIFPNEVEESINASRKRGASRFFSDRIFRRILRCITFSKLLKKFSILSRVGWVVDRVQTKKTKTKETKK